MVSFSGRFEGHTDSVSNSVAFSPDGSMIASTTPSSYGVYLMVRFSGRLRGTLIDGVNSVAFSPMEA
jgi:WD40 repeat protein